MCSGVINDWTNFSKAVNAYLLDGWLVIQLNRKCVCHSFWLITKHLIFIHMSVFFFVFLFSTLFSAASKKNNSEYDVVWISERYFPFHVALLKITGGIIYFTETNKISISNNIVAIDWQWIFKVLIWRIMEFFIFFFMTISQRKHSFWPSFHKFEVIYNKKDRFSVTLASHKKLTRGAIINCHLHSCINACYFNFSATATLLS